MERTKGNYIIEKNIIYFKNYDKEEFQFVFGKINETTIDLYREKKDKNPFSIPIIKK